MTNPHLLNIIGYGEIKNLSNNSIPHPRRKGKQKRRSVGRVEGSGEGLFTSCYSMTAGERTASQPEEPDTEPEPESDMDLMAAAYREGVSEA